MWSELQSDGSSFVLMNKNLSVSTDSVQIEYDCLKSWTKRVNCIVTKKDYIICYTQQHQAWLKVKSSIATLSMVEELAPKMGGT